MILAKKCQVCNGTGLVSCTPSVPVEAKKRLADFFDVRKCNSCAGGIVFVYAEEK